MKKNKKGITLVELVICCAIIVLLGGACTAVLLSGNNVFTDGSRAANARLGADVLQAYMSRLLPTAAGISQGSLAEAQASDAGSWLYFDGESDAFTLRVGSENTAIESITGFRYSVLQAGERETARAQLVYTVSLDDGSAVNGGFVLANTRFDPSIAYTDADLRDRPLHFMAND